jgi:hypothetical protein
MTHAAPSNERISGRGDRARLRSGNAASGKVVDSLLAQAIGTVRLVPLAQSRHCGDRGCPRVSRWVPGRRG